MRSIMMMLKILWMLLFLKTSLAVNCPSRCDCLTTSYGEEITCSNNETNREFKVVYNEGKKIMLQCLNNPVKFYEGMFQEFSFQDVKLVWFRDCQLPSIPFSAIFKPSNVTTLRLQADSGSVPDFSNTSFQGLDHLERLQLNGNRLQALPENIFQHLTNLKELIISNNLLTQLPLNVFQFTQNLAILDLSFNKLQLLDTQLRWLPFLTQLYLHANNFVTLNADMFQGVSQLETLDLQNNLLQILPSTVFHPLIKLQELKLFNNDLKNLSRDLFVKNTLLKVIHLHSNPELEILPKDIFKDLLLLEDINIAKCNLSSLPSNLFSDLGKLRTIDLSGNNIQSLSNTTFLNCNSLTEIILSNNNLSFSELCFQHLSGLRRLHLQHNSIHSLPGKIFSDLISLEELDLSFNHISSVPNEFRSLQSLKELKLQHNDVEIISVFSFTQCNNLETLDLSVNRLNSAEFYLPLNLKILNLSSNYISEMPMNFQASLMFLNIIDLSKNFISNISTENIHSVADDLIINLQNNNISNIDFTDHQLFYSEVRKRNIIQLLNNPIHCNCHLESFLQQLRKQEEGQVMLFTVVTQNLVCAAPPELNNREIISLNEEDLLCTIKNLCPKNCTCVEHVDSKRDMKCRGLQNIPSYAPSNITTLDLSNNNLSTIEGLNDSSWETVTSLNLTNNRLKSLASHLLPASLKNLNLQGNQLQLLSKDDIRRLSNGMLLLLGNNPWVCECKSIYFSEWLENASYVQDRDQMKCNNLPNVTVRNFLCLDSVSNKPSLVSIVIGMSLVAILATIAAIVFYKYQDEIKVWLYSKSICLSLFSKDDLDADKEYDAFISFSQDDIDWVSKELVPQLEQKEPYFHLCIHHRDWLVGEWIPNQIIRSVEISKRTIVVLSKNFLSSIWGHLEFKTAHYQALEDRMNRLIVIVLGDLPPVEEMDSEIRSYISFRTYLHWKDPWFWEKLRYAMPHTKNSSASSSSSSHFQNRAFSQVEVSSV